MIGFIFIGTLLGWIAAGAALVSGAGFLMALGALMGVGCGAAVALAGLALLSTPLRPAAEPVPA